MPDAGAGHRQRRRGFAIAITPHHPLFSAPPPTPSRSRRPAVAAFAAALTLALWLGGAPLADASPGDTATTPSGLLRFVAATRLSRSSELVAIACGSGSSCLVLDNRDGAAHFNGSGWSTLRPLHAGARGAGGVSVSCAGTSLCVAVPAGSNDLVEWNGTRWSAPVSVAGAVGLEAVGCARDGYCAAVDGVGNAFQRVGGRWQRTGGDWGAVSSIACTSAAFCVSVGPNGISSWDGSGWTLPAEHGATSAFTGVSCVGVSFCVAVDKLGEVLRWNGRAWSSPLQIDRGRSSATSLGPAPTGISCAAAARCVVVDDVGSAFELDHGAWSRVERDPARSFSGVSCPTPSLCMVTALDGSVLVGRP